MPAGGDKILINDYSLVAAASVTKPLVRLIQTAAQSIPNGTTTATPLTFTTETIDTDGFFNAGTSTSRIVPNRAGYYRVRGVLHLTGVTNYAWVASFIRKNGSGGTNQPPAGRLGGGAFFGNFGFTSPPTAAAIPSAAVECEIIIDMNGSTDYVELCATQANVSATAQLTVVGNQFASVFEVEYLRGL